MRQPIDLDYVSKAIVGIASPVVGVITSFQEQIEWHLRVSSLCVGLAVGVMSLVAMVRKWRGLIASNKKPRMVFPSEVSSLRCFNSEPSVHLIELAQSGENRLELVKVEPVSDLEIRNFSLPNPLVDRGGMT